MAYLARAEKIGVPQGVAMEILADLRALPEYRANPKMDAINIAWSRVLRLASQQKGGR